tara:strand:- start:196 stop:1452 length:1257 start_codon:yes stop_codon:yes gene_type:complete
MSEVITCIEHETLTVVESRGVGDFSITNKQASLLSNSERKLPKGAFNWGHKSIKFSQYCGLIQVGSLAIEILPKIHGIEADKTSSRHELVKMLRKAGFLKALPVGSAGVNTQSHTLLDIFVVHFCELLKESLIQGMPREYINIEENLGVLRGKLLISNHLRSNLAHNERLYCSYDELSEDILINQSIKYTLKLLLCRSRSSTVKQRVSQLLMMFDCVSDRTITEYELDQLIIDRTKQAFITVIEQCKMFIKGLNPDIYSGEHECFALLFDMNQLFEKWASSILKPITWSKNLQLREQGPKRFLAYREDIDKKVFQMKPDISILNESSEVILIADAKWKLLDSNDSKLGISQADLYQINTYATQYSVKSLVLLYPRQTNLLEHFEFSFQGNSKISVKVIPLDIHANGRHAELMLKSIIF